MWKSVKYQRLRLNVGSVSKVLHGALVRAVGALTTGVGATSVAPVIGLALARVGF